MVQNKAAINTSTSFNYLTKVQNKNNNIDNNNINNNPRTKLNFNEICNFKMEINKLVEENIYLKTQLMEIKSKISQFENMLERTDLKYQEQMNNYQKQLLKYNKYIHEVYLFFNNISINFFPKLNFSLQKNETILINFELFQSKLKSIEKYISDLNKRFNNNNSRILNNDSSRLLTDISFDKNSLEERVNFLEKKIMNKGIYKIPNKPRRNNINNSIRSKYDYYGVKENISYGNHICPKYHKISNNKLNKERLGTSFSKLDESSKRNYNKKYNGYSKNRNLTSFKKSNDFNNKRSLTPISKQKNLFYNI